MPAYPHSPHETDMTTRSGRPYRPVLKGISTPVSPLKDLIQRMPDVFHEGITSRLGFCDLLSLAAVDTTCRDEVRSLAEVHVVRTIRRRFPDYMWRSLSRFFNSEDVTCDIPVSIEVRCDFHPKLRLVSSRISDSSVDECDRSLARHAIQKHIQKHRHRHNRRVRLHVNVPVAWL